MLETPLSLPVRQRAAAGNRLCTVPAVHFPACHTLPLAALFLWGQNTRAKVALPSPGLSQPSA